MAVALAGQPVEPHGAKFRLIHYAIFLAQKVNITATSRAGLVGARFCPRLRRRPRLSLWRQHCALKAVIAWGEKSLVFSPLPAQGNRRMPPLEVLLGFALTTAVFAFIPGQQCCMQQPRHGGRSTCWIDGIAGHPPWCLRAYHRSCSRVVCTLPCRTGGWQAHCI